MTNNTVYKKISLSWALLFLAEQTTDVYFWAGSKYELVLPEMNIAEFAKIYTISKPVFYIKETKKTGELK